MNEALKNIYEMIQRGNHKVIGKAVEEALEKGDEPISILNDGMIAAMDEVGEKFKRGEIYVPEMLIAARAMKKGMEVLKPQLAACEVGALGKYILGTVSGDLHDIGKNLVGMMIESAGFEVIDLGVDVSSEKIIQAIKDNPDVKIVALSTLLTTTMPALGNTVRAINASGIEKTFEIMVGGAPISQEYADEIGADAYADDAAMAVEKAKAIVA
ncbi:MAG: cobalamin-dependent protein [Eubacterium sp.]